MNFRDLHPQNAHSPICSIVSGNNIDSRDEQSLNAQFATIFVPSFIDTEVFFGGQYIKHFVSLEYKQLSETSYNGDSLIILLRLEWSNSSPPSFIIP